MNTRPGLFHCILLLVALPIICQLGSVFVLVSTVNDVEKQIEKEERSSRFIFEGQILLNKVVDEFYTLGIGFDGVDENCFSSFQSRMRKLKPQFKRYIENLDAMPGRAKDAKELDTMWKALCAEIYPAGLAEPWRQETIVDTRMSRLGIAIVNKLDSIVKSVEVIDAEEARKKEESLNAAREWLTLLLVLSVVLTIIILFLYQAIVEKPLSRIASNGRLLAEREPLPPVLAGASEMSNLDRLLHQVSDSVEESIARETQAVENARDLICTIDDGAVFKSVNPYVERITGYKPDEVIGKNLIQMVVERDRDAFKRDFGKALVSRQNPEWHLRIVTRDERLVDTRWSCIHAPAEGSFFCIVSDISEEIRVQQLKQDFSETVSRDLRGPLVKLQNSMRAIRAGDVGEVPPAIGTMLDRIGNNVDRLLLLANDLLDYQRLRGSELVLEPAVHDLLSIVEEAVECVSGFAASKNINIELPEQACTLRCDRMRMLQTVVNLLSNAIKFTPNDSRIEVRLELVVRENQDDALVKLTVTDSGPGIAPQDRQRIFQAFEQVQNAQAKQGTGLGLAICKMFVEAHGGSIHVESTHAETGEQVTFSNGEIAGSSFVIDLPCRADSTV